ncbi:hypothetical protein [Bacteroides ovatus]|jgi:hypothetical protein|uniref:hypothetical protein n=1 Tax=Bacteroides ovatus TaxID=28116 RepID=UPI000E492A12|nr:hypothetical protein [Bacteroides ovatus]KAA3969205.1 hypothetical protein F3F61_24630 [Bacteroides ovatus]RHD30175.1 hypothetical protein DW803_04880 [Bacteroides ovatus]
MDEGFLRLSRRFFSNEMWKVAREFSECEAWLDLIQSARFEATDKAYSELIGGREISYTRGQYPASISFLMKRWQWSEKKVRYFLAKLKKRGMITTCNKQGMTVITLCNYDEYNPVKGKGEDIGRGIDNNKEISELNNALGELRAELRAVVEKMGQAKGDNKKKDEEDNTKESPYGDKKNAAKAATLSRKESFYQSLVPFVGKYQKEMIRSFFDYWSELNKSETKMRYELEKTWELPKRLATWANREKIPAKPTTDIGVVLKDNSPDKYDSPQERKWEERWNK